MERLARVCRWLVGAGIGALVLFTPLAFGSVEPWAVTVLETALFAITGLWLLGRGLAGDGRMRSAGGTPLTIPIVLFVGVVVLQMIPLPRAALSVLSPRASSLYERTIPGYARPASGFEDWLLATDAARHEIAPASSGRSLAEPVSYAPAETRDRLVLFVAYTLLFFVAADRYRDP